MCTIDKRPTQLFVTSTENVMTDATLVACAALNQVSRLYQLVQTIVQKMAYTGFGCFNTKFVPDQMSLADLDAYLLSLPPPKQGEELVTTFDDGIVNSDNLALDAAATPKLFDFNVRMCGTQMDYGMLLVVPMMRQYMNTMP